MATPPTDLSVPPLPLKPTVAPLLDDMAAPVPLLNGDKLETPSLSEVAAPLALNGNGIHPRADAAPDVEPTTHVSSGIQGVGAFLAEAHPEIDSLLGNPTPEVPSVVDAVEAPVSDARDEAPPVPSIESTQNVPETQLASQESDPLAQTDAMDVSHDIAQAPPAQGPPTTSMTELSINTQATAPSQPQLIQSPTTQDHEMADAPASGKVRPREEDGDEMDEDERDTKRTKTLDEAEDKAEFKVPNIPVHSEQPNGHAPQPTASTPTTASAPAAETSHVHPAVTYKPWPTTPMNDAQRKFLLERVRNTKKIKVSMAFKDPVDPVALNIPTYTDVVKNPMDLTTMEGKLKDGKYSLVADFMADLDQIIINSELFNSKDHSITQNGYNMRAYFLKGTDRLPQEGEELTKPVKPVKKPSVSVATKPRRESRAAATTAKSPTAPTPTAASPSTAWPLNSDGLPLIRRDSSSANDRPKREIHRPPSKDLPYSTAKPRKKKYQQELKFCESVLAEIMKPKYAKFSYPFLSAVDPVALNIPSYLKIIKKPMDFGTVEKNLKAGVYQSAKDFHTDAQLVFANCFKFNPDGDEVHKMGKQLSELFETLWAEKADWLAQHAPEAEPQSPTSMYSDEEDEEEEEPDASGNAQIAFIQQQIAALNETAQLLLQQQNKGKRAASPKAPSKKKSKPQHKRKNTQLSVPPPAKPAKTKARVKAPAPLSYAQKQEISEGISTLGDSDMRRAVQIIRNGCPNLANTHDDEMELDMDEINDDTLRELFKFIKAVRGPKGAVADDDYELPAQKLSRQNTARPKKNKPMGKSEQEDSLRKIQEKMQSFSGNGRALSGSSQSPAADQDDSSDDETSGSESEEE